jgi:hypothetical protein
VTGQHLPPEDWIPILAERTARQGDQIEILWNIVRRTLDEETREKIQQEWFHYRCGLERGDYDSVLPCRPAARSADKD